MYTIFEESLNNRKYFFLAINASTPLNFFDKCQKVFKVESGNILEVGNLSRRFRYKVALLKSEMLKEIMSWDDIGVSCIVLDAEKTAEKIKESLGQIEMVEDDDPVEKSNQANHDADYLDDSKGDCTRGLQFGEIRDTLVTVIKSEGIIPLCEDDDDDGLSEEEQKEWDLDMKEKDDYPFNSVLIKYFQEKKIGQPSDGEKEEGVILLLQPAS